MTKQDILHHIPFYNNSAFIYGKKCLCRSCRIHHHMPEVQREVSSIWDYAQIRLKSLLRQVKEESEKVDLKLNIQKTKIMASGPISSVQFSLSVVSKSLRPHCSAPGFPVHHRFPEFTQTHVSCLSSRWCHPNFSSSVMPFSSCPQYFPASGSFPMSQLFASGGQSIGVSASTSVLPMNTQDWSPSEWTGWISLQSKGLSRVFSNTIV